MRAFVSATTRLPGRRDEPRFAWSSRSDRVLRLGDVGLIVVDGRMYSRLHFGTEDSALAVMIQACMLVDHDALFVRVGEFRARPDDRDHRRGEGIVGARVAGLVGGRPVQNDLHVELGGLRGDDRVYDPLVVDFVHRHVDGRLGAVDGGDELRGVIPVRIDEDRHARGRADAAAAASGARSGPPPLLPPPELELEATPPELEPLLRPELEPAPELEPPGWPPLLVPVAACESSLALPQPIAIAATPAANAARVAQYAAFIKILTATISLPLGL